jgi:hypothetical protein
VSWTLAAEGMAPSGTPSVETTTDGVDGSLGIDVP